MRSFFSLLFAFFFLQPSYSLVKTKNKELYQKIQKRFQNKKITKIELDKFLVDHNYYLAEVIEKKDHFFIKNPYKIIFIIRGNRFFKDKEVRKFLKIDENKKGSSFYTFIENQIESAYKEKGFLKVRIEKKESIKKWKKWYELNVLEGNVTSLGALQIRGLLSRPFAFYEDKILKNSPELQKGFFNKKALEKGKKALINHLKSEGYLQAKIYSDRVFFKDDKAFVTVNLEEGPLSFVADIQISGVESFALWEILSQMETKIQSRVQMNTIKKDLEKIEALYEKRGFLRMKIKNKKSVIQYLKESKDVVLLIEIEEGLVFPISRIEFKGLEKVNPSLVRKLLLFKEGDFLTTEKKEKSIQNLAGTALFTNVNIEHRIQNELLEIDILFQERERRSLKGGLGFNSQRNLTTRVYTELTHRNLFGWGRAFVTRGTGQVSLTQREPFLEYDLSARYKEVFIYGKGYDGDISVSRSKSIFRYSRENINFVKKTLISFFVNKKITESLNLKWTLLSFENRIEDCTSMACPENPQRISSSAVQAFFDKRNNIFSPSEGYLFSYKAEIASPFLGGSPDIAFLKMDFHNYFYLTFLAHYTLGFVLKSGFLSSFQRSESIPVSRAFILGGQSSLRAYDGNIAGERIPRRRYTPIQTANEILRLKKGKSIENVLRSQYNLLKLDFRFPVFEGFKGVLFYDLGTVYLGAKNNSLVDYGHSVGLGFRYQTFLIPIGLDIAYQLPPKECIRLENKSCAYSRFHFSIGW